MHKDATLKQLLAQMAEVLDAEFEALRQRDADALAASVERKHALADALAGLDLAGADDETRALLASCQRANRRMGGALQLHQQLTTGLLDALHGNRRGAPVYTANGRMQSRDAARQLGSA